MEIPVTEKLEE